MTNIKDKLISIPKQSGVYFFKDKFGEIIYVGKAANLRDRLGSYFSTTSSISPKLTSLISSTYDFEYILTNNEVEALILENNLIKKYKPKYNIRLKDDKTYPYIKITTNEEFPRIIVTRKMKSDKTKYFGPYTSASSMRKVIKLIKQLFLIATCNKKIKLNENKYKLRACLQYQIKNCCAPCSGLIKKEEYKELVMEACQFLEGKYENILKKLDKRMHEAAENLHYELAATIRDKIRALRKVMEEQIVVFNKFYNFDIFGISCDTHLSCITVLFIRNGKLIDRANFLVSHNEEDKNEILNSFIKNFYITSGNLPKVILLGYEIKDKDNLINYLREKRNTKVKIIVPERGKNKELVEMATQNATNYLNTVLTEEKRKQEEKKLALIELKNILNLKKIPNTIDAIDISNLYGREAVGSVVVFKDGMPYKGGYRRYKIKTVDFIDDYAMIKEVINRRYKRIQEENTQLPDLILIDGGKGQLNTACEVLFSLGIINDVDIISIAKREELIFTKDSEDGIKIDERSKALHIIQHIRDEAHRFAIYYHRKLMKKRIR